MYNSEIFKDAVDKVQEIERQCSIKTHTEALDAIKSFKFSFKNGDLKSIKMLTNIKFHFEIMCTKP